MTCRCVNFSVAGASFLLFLSSLGTAARADVAVYRTGQLASRVQRVPSEIRRGVFAEPRRYCEPLVTGAPQEFKIRVHGAEAVHLRTGTTRWLPMPQAADAPQVYRLSAQVSPGDTVQIVAKPPGRNQQHWTVVDFAPQSNSGR